MATLPLGQNRNNNLYRKIDNRWQICGEIRENLSYNHFSFYNDGSLLGFRTLEKIEIDGIPCMKKKEIVLYPDGSLYKFFLAKGFKIEGKNYKKREHVFFDENGKIAKFQYRPEILNEYERRIFY